MFYIRLISLLLIFVCAQLHAAVIYVYVNASGNRLLTDHPISHLQGYKLVKKYGVDDYFGLIDGPAEADSDSYRTLHPRRSEFDNLIFSTAETMGLEAALLKAIVHVESSFNPDVLSAKGAKGLMQLMPATARRYGVISRSDPVESLAGGGRYMKDLLALFDSDIRLALAAYNAGENAVMKYNGIPPYSETRDYVEKVLTLREKYKKNLTGRRNFRDDGLFE